MAQKADTLDRTAEPFMRVVAEYSLKDAKTQLQQQYSAVLQEVNDIIQAVNASKYKTKRSKEKTMLGKLLYMPGQINRAFEREFKRRGWQRGLRIECDYRRVGKYFWTRLAAW